MTSVSTVTFSLDSHEKRVSVRIVYTRLACPGDSRIKLTNAERHISLRATAFPRQGVLKCLRMEKQS